MFLNKSSIAVDNGFRVSDVWFLYIPRYSVPLELSTDCCKLTNPSALVCCSKKASSGVSITTVSCTPVENVAAELPSMAATDPTNSALNASKTAWYAKVLTCVELNWQVVLSTFSGLQSGLDAIVPRLGYNEGPQASNVVIIGP